MTEAKKHVARHRSEGRRAPSPERRQLFLATQVDKLSLFRSRRWAEADLKPHAWHGDGVVQFTNEVVIFPQRLTTFEATTEQTSGFTMVLIYLEAPPAG